MEYVARKLDIKSILINVTEEISKNSILDFAVSSLNLNNIEYSPSDNIYCIFLEYSMQYQIIVFNNKFKYIIFELIFDNKINVQKNIFSLYIAKDFFVIFRGKSLYTYQEISQEYTKEELIEYIFRNFNISIKDTKVLNESDLEKVIKSNINNSNFSSLKNINIKSKKPFYIYLGYIIICLLSLFLYRTYEKEIYKKEELFKIQEDKRKYLNTIKILKFKPFIFEYSELINMINNLNLELISLTYGYKTMKIKVSSRNKNNLYLLLKHYKNNLLENSISKQESKNIFIGVFNVKSNSR